MKITSFIVSKAIIPDLKSKNKKMVVTELVKSLKGELGNSKTIIAEITNTILEREKIGSTGIGQGVAIPHTKTPHVKRTIGAFGRSVKGIDFDAVDAEKAHVFFLILSPVHDDGTYHRALAAVMTTLKKPHVCNFLKNAKTIKDIEEIFRESEEAINV